VLACDLHQQAVVFRKGAAPGRRTSTCSRRGGARLGIRVSGEATRGNATHGIAPKADAGPGLPVRPAGIPPTRPPGSGPTGDHVVNRSIFERRVTEFASERVPRRGTACSWRIDGTKASARSRTCRRPTANWQPRRCRRREVDVQDRSKSAERSRRPLSYPRDQEQPFQTAALLRVSARNKERDRRSRSERLQRTRTEGAFPCRSAATRAPRRIPGKSILARDCCIRLHEYTCLLGTSAARSCRDRRGTRGPLMAAVQRGSGRRVGSHTRCERHGQDHAGSNCVRGDHHGLILRRGRIRATPGQEAAQGLNAVLSMR
jgi:hypothetical protein